MRGSGLVSFGALATAVALAAVYFGSGAPTIFAGFDRLVMPNLAVNPELVSGPGQGDRVQLASVWVARVASETGISPVAVHAYAGATQQLASDDPGCHLAWNTLAGIGYVESQHGTHGGTSLGADGVPGRLIIGPALDGSGGTRAIRTNSAWAAWTGDAVWDHAVGPMQFISSTWAKWGADGDSDAIANPHDIDDAALAAGRYLCAAGGDLGLAAGWTRAVGAYNHSDEYVDSVLRAANRYAAATRS